VEEGKWPSKYVGAPKSVKMPKSNDQQITKEELLLITLHVQVMVFWVVMPCNDVVG
jgi:hypothetical protein